MKMNLWKKIICVLMIVPLVLMSACSKKGNEAEIPNDGTVVEATEDYVGPGVHEATVTKTAGTLIAAGETEYKIMIPDDYVNYEYMGAELIADWLYKATGCQMQIFRESEISDADKKVIAIGDTDRLKASGISVAESYLGENGFVVLSQGETTYISGARTVLKLGTLYGAQEFLKYTINWHPYTIDEVYYEEAVRIPYYDMDIVEVPDYQNRRIGYYELTRDETYLHYMRQNVQYERGIPFGMHSHFMVLEPSVYANAHPDWYYSPETGAPYDGSTWTSQNNSKFVTYGQLNISNEEMKAEFIAQLTKLFLEDYPDAEYVTLGPQDSPNYCKCVNCQAKMAQYNTNYAGIAIMFTNDVARAVQENIHAVDPSRDIFVYYGAYFAQLAPPAHKDENGQYVADAPEVVPDPDVVCISFCPHGYNASELITSTSNSVYYEYLLGWEAITEGNMRAHIYSMNFTNCLLTHKDNDTMAANWRTFSEHGCTEAYTQGALMENAAQWTPMKLYIQSMLMWNLSLNYDELAYDFIEHYYGEYADDIREMYNLMTTYTEYAHSALHMSGNVYLSLLRKNYWSFGYVEAGRKVMERVLGRLEAIKDSDPEKYDHYYMRVSRVFLENVYLRFELYIDEYTADEANPVIDWFESVVNRFGIVWMTESSREENRASYHIETWRSFYNG